jgi:hypothetical protein
MAWPRTRDLITQQKFIYAYLYFCPDATACGCYLISVDRSAADLSMTAASLDDALDEFARRGLILRDKTTGEIYVVDWPRWHVFSSPPARGALWDSISKIQSRSLWIKVENAYKSIPKPGKGKEKSKGKASSEEEGSGPPPPSRQQPTRSPSGIRCWTQEDHREAHVLAAQYGEQRIQEAVHALEKDGIEPLPSRVTKALQPRAVKLPPWWWKSESGTNAAADMCGLTAHPGEALSQFQQRIRDATERITALGAS